MEGKRKLAYIIHGLGVGGAEIAFLSALPSLHERFDLRVYVLGGSPNHRLVCGLDGEIKKRMRFYDFGVYALPFYLPLVYRAICAFKPAIIISSLWRSSIAALLYKFFHGHVKYFILLHSSGFFHWADRFFTKRGMHICDAIFADSQATGQFAKHLMAERTDTTVLSYLVTQSPTELIRHTVTSKKRFFFVGRINSVKRLPLAVKAIAWLREKGVDAALHIYGRDDGDRTNVEREIRDHNLEEYITFEGEVSPEERHRVYASYSYYLQLSGQEGMAMSVAEAMQHGVICIVTPVGGIAQYACDGHSAIFVDTTSEQGWEDSMQKILAALEDPEQCAAISRAAYHTFKNAPVFADSLIAAIDHYVE